MSPTQTATSIIERVGSDTADWRVALPDGHVLDAARFAFPLAGAPVSVSAQALEAARAGKCSANTVHTAAAALLATEAVLDIWLSALERDIAERRDALVGVLAEVDAAAQKAEQAAKPVAEWARLRDDWREIRDRARATTEIIGAGIAPNEAEIPASRAAAQAALEGERAEHHTELARDRAEVAIAALGLAIADTEIATADLCEAVGAYGRIVGVRARIRSLFAQIEHAAAVAVAANPS